MIKTLRWLIVFVGAAIVTYLLLSTPRGRASHYTQTVREPAVAGNGR